MNNIRLCISRCYVIFDRSIVETDNTLLLKHCEIKNLPFHKQCNDLWTVY